MLARAIKCQVTSANVQDRDALTSMLKMISWKDPLEQTLLSLWWVHRRRYRVTFIGPVLSNSSTVWSSEFTVLANCWFILEGIRNHIK